jgi:hypothetical protein
LLNKNTMNGLLEVELAESRAWAISQLDGVEINGFAPVKFPGQGLGLVPTG